jgi:hypothetical protein
MISFGRNSLTQQKRYKKPIQCRGIVLDTCFPASGNKKIAMTKIAAMPQAIVGLPFKHRLHAGCKNSVSVPAGAI